MKKRFFILIEVVISLFLISILLTFLFGFFSKITKIEKEVESKKQLIYARNHTYVRLNTIFSQISSDGLNDSRIYTKRENNDKNSTLYVSFDAGVDPDPFFSGIVEAKIFINKTNDLILEIFSKEKPTKDSREEPLIKNIKKIEYKFLAEKDLNMGKYKLEEITKNILWYNFWPREKKTSPHSIYIKIDDNLEFAFFLTPLSVKI